MPGSFRPGGIPAGPGFLRGPGIPAGPGWSLAGSERILSFFVILFMLFDDLEIDC